MFNVGDRVITPSGRNGYVGFIGAKVIFQEKGKIDTASVINIKYLLKKENKMNSVDEIEQLCVDFISKTTTKIKNTAKEVENETQTLIKQINEASIPEYIKIAMLKNLIVELDKITPIND